jgi:hypothetical protein
MDNWAQKTSRQTWTRINRSFQNGEPIGLGVTCAILVLFSPTFSNCYTLFCRWNGRTSRTNPAACFLSWMISVLHMTSIILEGQRAHATLTWQADHGFQPDERIIHAWPRRHLLTEITLVHSASLDRACSVPESYYDDDDGDVYLSAPGLGRRDRSTDCSGYGHINPLELSADCDATTDWRPANHACLNCSLS